MLRLIPQEQPEGQKQIPQPRKKGKGGRKMPTNFPVPSDRVIEETGKKLLMYSMKPDEHSDEDLSQIIHACHRSVLCLQRKRQQKGKKKGKKK